jgi:predicted nucleotidyltransferase
MDTSRRVCDIQFSLIVNLASAHAMADQQLVRQLYASRRNWRKQKHNSDFIVASCANSLQQWATAPNCSLTTIRGGFEARHHLRDLAVNVIEEISSHNIPIAWALGGREGLTDNLEPQVTHVYETRRYTTTDVLKHIVSQILQQNHTLLNERSVGLNIARFQSATTEAQWFSLFGSVVEGMDAVYIIIDIDVLVSAAPTETIWPEAFVNIFQQIRVRNIRTMVKVAFLSARGARNASLLGSKGKYCVDLPKIKSGRIEKKIHSPKFKRRSQRQTNVLLKNGLG